MEIYLKKFSKFKLMQFIYGYRNISNSLYLIKIKEGFKTLDELISYRRFKIGFLICRLQY